MKKAIIVDIDGTLSNNDHRQHFIAGEKKDWKSFSESCHLDKINAWCQYLVNGMQMNDAVIIYVSGRSEEYKPPTKNFINEHCELNYHLYMRKSGDYRADTIIKEEIYNEHIKGKYHVLFCVDDRPSVCRMWRSLGLTVLQCNDKEF